MWRLLMMMWGWHGWVARQGRRRNCSAHRRLQQFQSKIRVRLLTSPPVPLLRRQLDPDEVEDNTTMEMILVRMESLSLPCFLKAHHQHLMGCCVHRLLEECRPQYRLSSSQDCGLRVALALFCNNTSMVENL